MAVGMQETASGTGKEFAFLQEADRNPNPLQLLNQLCQWQSLTQVTVTVAVVDVVHSEDEEVILLLTYYLVDEQVN